MKQLIVNADDFGISERRNAGIIQAHQRGIVTSVSVLVNGDAFEDAKRWLKACPELDIGLHLNLSEGKPLVAGHRTLVNSEGQFFGKSETRRLSLEGRFDPQEVKRETKAQWEKLSDFRVTHLDGHQHIHIYGPISEPIAEVAAKVGIRYVRHVADSLLLPSLSQERCQQREHYCALSQESARIYARHGLAQVDRFIGVALSYQMSWENIIVALRSLGHGMTEWMVHPGFSDEAEGFAGPTREQETLLLQDPRLRTLLSEEQIELTHFGRG